MGNALLRLTLCAAVGAVTVAGSERVSVVAVTAWAQTVTKDQAVIVLDESSSGSVGLAVGRRLEIRLKAQLGAGFSWNLDGSGGTAVKLLGERLDPLGTAEGSPSVQVFTFEAAAPGEAHLTFAYRRPWLKTQPPAKLLTFIVRVAAK